jgi:penicillin-binding protein 1A
MQVTRNFLLTREKRVSRKIKELILASQLEKVWGKKRILHIYLNEIYLGEGCYGVEAAARNYFDKPVGRLSVAEAALVAGLVAGPARFNPFKSVELAQMRQKIVLASMVRAGFITVEDYNKALTEKLVFRKEMPRPFDLVPDFAEAVRMYIVAKYGADVLYNQGLNVFTTVRLDYQHKAEAAVAKGLEEIKARHKHSALIGNVLREHIPALLRRRSNPTLTDGRLYQAVVTRVIPKKTGADLEIALSTKVRGKVELDQSKTQYKVGNVLALRFERFVDETPYFTLDEDPQIQGALVVIENRTGHVKALVGGVSREHYKFNRATQAKRQPGSAFKPVIYATAIEKKSYTPATVIVDEPIVIDLETRDEAWEPRNAGGDFIGPVSLRTALELSRNICTVKILMDLGFDDVIETSGKMGISTRLGRNLSLSLGTSEVTLLELTSAYSVFPNSGVHVWPTLVKRVEDRFGNVLEDNSEVPVLEQDQIPHPVAREEFSILDEEDQGPSESLRGQKQVAGRRAHNPSPLAKDNRVQPGPSAQGRPGSNPTEKELDEEAATSESAEPEAGKVVAAISPASAYIMTSLLQGVIRSGTGARVSQYLKRKDLAGKTGTTNKAEDAWFIGFNPDYTTGVWVGFDEKRPLGTREEGARSALPIWAYVMRGILQNVPEREFPVPPDVTYTEMFTYAGTVKGGFVPQTVREPVYTPFVGRTLVLCPLDPPETLSSYAGPAYSAVPYNPAMTVYPPGVPPRNFPVQPLMPGPAGPGRPMDEGSSMPGQAASGPPAPSPNPKAPPPATLYKPQSMYDAEPEFDQDQPPGQPLRREAPAPPYDPRMYQQPQQQQVKPRGNPLAYPNAYSQPRHHPGNASDR